MGTYDTIVVGGGLSGLLLTHLFHKEGHNVTLLEAREGLGGHFRRPKADSSFSSSGLEFIPASSEQIATLEWLKSVCPLPITWKVQDHQPICMSEGVWKPFLGFGETTYQTAGELSFYNTPQELILDQGLEQVVRSLAEQLPIAAQTRSEVTSFNTNEGRITGCVVNGDKTLEAANFIFTPPTQLLNDLITGESLAPKHRTRLAKSTAWTVLTLSLEHQNKLNASGEIRYLLSGAKDFEPVVGRSTGHRSKWSILISPEQAEDNEYISSCFKHIKRLLKRAFPESEPVVQEKFHVQPFGFGTYNLKTKSPFLFPELPNLYLAYHGLTSLPGDLGAVAAAQGAWNEFKGFDLALTQMEEPG